MRLLKVNDDGRYGLVWFQKDNIPQRYAILSHTWGQGEDDEVTYKDMMNGTGQTSLASRNWNSARNRQSMTTCNYFWIDTCCIDKSNHNELATAINSMFRWLS